jgi:hypothetical protein
MVHAYIFDYNSIELEQKVILHRRHTDCPNKLWACLFLLSLVNNFSKTQDVKQMYLSKLKIIILTVRKAMDKFCLITEQNSN